MAHDQLFNEFLREFLRDFLRLFFPEIEARFDFGALQFLDTESFTSFTEGSSWEADFAAEVPTRGELQRSSSFTSRSRRDDAEPLRAGCSSTSLSRG